MFNQSNQGIRIMATTISHCNECGFFGSGGDFCSSISCRVFVIRHFGEILDFSNNTFRFTPKVGSTLQPIVFHDKSFSEVIDFLYPKFLELYKDGVK